MLEALLVAALLSVTDPPGDVGSGALTAPTATLFRPRDVFDIRSLEVQGGDTLSIAVGLEQISRTFPQPLLEVYLSDPKQTGARELLPGSQLRLPRGASWRYAFRIVGETVAVFAGRSGDPIDITEVSGARLSVSGTTLRLTTKLPSSSRFSVYAMSGSYDPFSPDGWRSLRENPAPWGFSGTAAAPVLDIVADTPGLQERALEQGILPEIRASFAQPGWLAVAGAGVTLALAGFAVRLGFSRRPEPPPALQLAPLTEQEVRRRAKRLEALAQGRGTLVAAARQPEPAAGPAPTPQAVMN